MDCSPSNTSVHGDSPGRNTAVGCHALLHGIFQTQVSHIAGGFFTEPLGKPKNTGEGSLSLLQRIFTTQEANQGSLHCRWILYQLSYQGAIYIYIYISLSYQGAIYIYIYISPFLYWWKSHTATFIRIPVFAGNKSEAIPQKQGVWSSS